MMFEEWRATRRFVDNLSAHTDCEHEIYVSGFIYCQGAAHIEAREWGFGVLIGNCEREFTSLDDAERWLWEEFAESEMNA